MARCDIVRQRTEFLCCNQGQDQSDDYSRHGHLYALLRERPKDVVRCRANREFDSDFMLSLRHPVANLTVQPHKYEDNGRGGSRGEKCSAQLNGRELWADEMGRMINPQERRLGEDLPSNVQQCRDRARGGNA